MKYARPWVRKRWANFCRVALGLGSSGFLQEILARLFEAAVKGGGAQPIPSVDQLEKGLEFVEQPLAISGHGRV